MFAHIYSFRVHRNGEVFDHQESLEQAEYLRWTKNIKNQNSIVGIYKNLRYD